MSTERAPLVVVGAGPGGYAAAFLAATIAGARPMRTCLTAMRLGVVIYFVPLFFLFQPFIQ